MTKSEVAVTTLSRKEVSIFYQIVREELKRENITWENFVSRVYTPSVRRARHRVVWRLSQELKLTKKTTADLIEIDESTVRGILKTLTETNGVLPKQMFLQRTRRKPITENRV